MLILGVDPGTRVLGWGLISTQGTRLVHVAHGAIQANANDSLSSRLGTIQEGLKEVIVHYKPNEAAVESLFFAKDASAAAKLGHARGVVLVTLHQAQIPMSEYAPASIKRAVAGNGRADKEQVARMVCAILGLKNLTPLDASDALAMAITHVRAAPARAIAARARKAIEETHRSLIPLRSSSRTTVLRKKVS